MAIAQPSWPPKDWKNYLQSLALKSAKLSHSKRQFIVPQSIAAPADDYRFHLLPKFLFKRDSITDQHVDEHLKQSVFATYPYQYSYRDLSSGDHWAVFMSANGELFNINLSLYPANSPSFEQQYQKVSELVENHITNPTYDRFFEGALYIEGAWNHRPMRLLHQNETWPGSSGVRLETYPVGPALGDPNDHLMIENEMVFYREEHLMLQKVRRFRSTETRDENLNRGRHYFGLKTAGEQDVLSKGQEKFLELFIEIHAAVFPDYVGRRDWTEAFLEKMFKEALSMQDQIEFTLIRELTADLKFGRIVGIVGFNSAAYGKVDHWSAEQHQWIRSTGMTGTSVARYHSDEIPYGDANYERELWSKPIPFLPFENRLASGQNLPRPAVLERIERPSTKTTDHREGPIFFYSGENLEVTRLWVAKDHPQRKEIFAKILTSWIYRVHALGKSLEYTLKAMSHMTYNPEKEGRRLYSQFGYSVDPSLSIMEDSFNKAAAFVSDSGRFIQAITDPTFVEKHLTADDLQALTYFIFDQWNENYGAFIEKEENH
jgi:hypothetical protein